MNKKEEKLKYYYDEEACEYKPLQKNAKYYLIRILFYGFTAAAMSSTLLYGFFAIYDSDKTKELKQARVHLVQAKDQSAALQAQLKLKVDSLKELERDIYRKALNAEPEDEKVDDSEEPVSQEFNAASIAQMKKELEEVGELLSENKNATEALLRVTEGKKVNLDEIPSIRPVKSEIISGHGLRKHPFSGQERMHNGIDFKADVGTPVMATADGRVIEAGVRKSGMGLTVVLRHGHGYVTQYSHLSEIKVRVGKSVKRGEIIALSGNSGLSKGPHLNYQILVGGSQVDPIDFFFADLSPDDFIKFKEKAAQYNESMN